MIKGEDYIHKIWILYIIRTGLDLWGEGYGKTQNIFFFV